MTSAVSSDLLDLTASLVAIPSLSHQEGQLADAVEAALRLCPWLGVERLGNNVVARTDLGRSSRLILAGHLDTVPPTAGNDQPRLDGDTLYGLGAADMKGGLATFLHLAGTIPEPAVDVTWCFYACEEVARRDSGLAELWQRRPELLGADAAILGEPTGGVVEAGCQGTMRIQVSLVGERAHTARPFTGRNAIHRLGPVLDAIAAYPGRRVVIDGCEYAEQLQAVLVEGGVANNVVPDRAVLTINHRFAPDRDAAEAEASVRLLLDETIEPEDSWEMVEAVAGAPPSLGNPHLSRLVAATGAAPRAKVGWTDVASFAAHGIPATNFGPGDPLLAHTPGEHVSLRELDHAAAVLERVLTTDS
ncbi:MAG TPA: succinyl-diaminopimelate desuccinylase [Acidimicrobiales bacterium]|nr:succinyl-diaminopimelate desuccinylase [Acidimicrobiales bacterium]